MWMESEGQITGKCVLETSTVLKCAVLTPAAAIK